MLSNLLHAIHTGSSDFVNAVVPAGGSAGPAINNLLNFPAELILQLEALVRSFGS